MTAYKFEPHDTVKTQVNINLNPTNDRFCEKDMILPKDSVGTIDSLINNYNDGRYWVIFNYTEIETSPIRIWVMEEEISAI